jgi:hypothetical protein
MRVIAADPKNKDGYYTAAVLDWNIVWADVHKAYLAAGVVPTIQLPDANARRSLREKHQARIEEGLRMMQLALQAEPGWSDALAYFSLLYRSDAMISETTPDYNELIRKADQNVMKALDSKRAGIMTEAATTPLTPAGPPPATLRLPPPPPPPPPGRPHGEPAR